MMRVGRLLKGGKMRSEVRFLMIGISPNSQSELRPNVGFTIGAESRSAIGLPSEWVRLHWLGLRSPAGFRLR